MPLQRRQWVDEETRSNEALAAQADPKPPLWHRWRRAVYPGRARTEPFRRSSYVDRFFCYQLADVIMVALDRDSGGSLERQLSPRQRRQQRA